ncbi:MAG: hypothetical protein P8M17_01150 [Saprospiraceae bacterium]|nr:hypothetical protein [Saprospiraceae bacterium]
MVSGFRLFICIELSTGSNLFNLMLFYFRLIIQIYEKNWKPSTAGIKGGGQPN